MADTIVTLTGDDAQLFKAIQRLVDQQAKLEGGFKKTKDSSKAAGDQAKKSAAEAAKETDGWGNAVDGAITKIGGMAAAYVSVQGAISLVGNVISENLRLQEESYNLAKEIAKSQQEAAKNLTGITSSEMVATLNVAAPNIASAAGFADIAKITDALGAGYSASGNLQKTISAVEAAAKLTRLTPDQLPEVAAGALDVSRGSGLTDAEANLAFLLSAGKSARIDDPAKLAGTIAPVVSSGVATVPSQPKEQAAIEIASLFTALNQQATDKKGDSTRTATTQFLAKLDDLFSNLGDNKKLDKKIEALEKKKTLSDTEKSELESMISLRSIGQNMTDPGTVFGRIKALQENEQLRGQFFGKEWGEMAFKKAFEMVTDSKSDLSKMMEENAKEISFNKQTFATKVSEMDKATPQIAVASAETKFDAAIAAYQMGDTRSQANVAMVNITKKALEKASTGSGQVVANWIAGYMLSGSSMGSSESMAAASKDQLEQRLRVIRTKAAFAGRPLTEEEIKKVGVLFAAYQEIDNLMANQSAAIAASKKAELQQTPEPIPNAESKKADELKPYVDQFRKAMQGLTGDVSKMRASFESMTRNSQRVGFALDQGARAAKTSAQKQAALRANAGGE